MVHLASIHENNIRRIFWGYLTVCQLGEVVNQGLEIMDSISESNIGMVINN